MVCWVEESYLRLLVIFLDVTRTEVSIRKIKREGIWEAELSVLKRSKEAQMKNKKIKKYVEDVEILG